MGFGGGAWWARLSGEDAAASGPKATAATCSPMMGANTSPSRRTSISVMLRSSEDTCPSAHRRGARTGSGGSWLTSVPTSRHRPVAGEPIKRSGVRAGRQRRGQSTGTVAWHGVQGSCGSAARRSKLRMKRHMRLLRFPVKPKVSSFTAQAWMTDLCSGTIAPQPSPSLSRENRPSWTPSRGSTPPGGSIRSRVMPGVRRCIPSVLVRMTV